MPLQALTIADVRVGVYEGGAGWMLCQQGNTVGRVGFDVIPVDVPILTEISAWMSFLTAAVVVHEVKDVKR